MGDGDGVGAGSGVGVAFGSGVGVGAGVGAGVDAGVGVAAAAVGVITMSAVAAAVSVTMEPPVNTDISGVNRLKWPVTVRVARLPYALLHDGVQASETSAGAMVTNEFRDSFVAAHITRLVVALQALPLEYDVGLMDASITPSRAEFVTVICE